MVEADGSRLTDLAVRAQITKQSTSYLVDYLEPHGYVKRMEQLHALLTDLNQHTNHPGSPCSRQPRG